MGSKGGTMSKEILFWMILVVGLVIIFITNQYVGYKRSEKDILNSCLSNNEVTIDGVRLVCFSCGTDKNVKEEQ